MPLNITISKAIVKSAPAGIAAIGTNSSKVYFLAKEDLSYTVLQNVELTLQPTTMAWGYNEQTLLIGLSNGSVTVLTARSKALTWSQVINTTFPVTSIAGGASRVITCSLGDSAINIYFYNLTTQQYTLNQTITSPMNGKCSSLTMSPWEERIVVGRSTGDIYTYKCDSNMFNTEEYTMLQAHSSSVHFIKIPLKSNLISASDDGILRLWSETNNFTTEISQFVDVAVVGWGRFSERGIVVDNNSTVTVLSLKINCALGLLSAD